MHNRLVEFSLLINLFKLYLFFLILTKIHIIIGSEAMFADLGHFSVRAIQVSKEKLYIYTYNVYSLFMTHTYTYALKNWWTISFCFKK
jgi:K+ transporter